ncbi:hypothetical protein REPUB_Repub09cG0055000 [Reevesia pubescens]
MMMFWPLHPLITTTSLVMMLTPLTMTSMSRTFPTIPSTSLLLMLPPLTWPSSIELMALANSLSRFASSFMYPMLLLLKRYIIFFFCFFFFSKLIFN